MRGFVFLAAAMVMAGLLSCNRHQPTPGKSPRIITLAPHATEMAFDMGIGDHVVGVSNYCVLPPGEHRPAVGSPYSINAEAILAEDPDIIFYNQKDEDFKSIQQLKPSVKLVRLRNDSLALLRESVAKMGQAVGREDLSSVLLARIDRQLNAVRRIVAGRPRPRVLWVMGTEHPVAIGAGTWMNELLELAGGTNAAAENNLQGWPSINLETVLQMNPDVLICILTGEKERAQDAVQYWGSVPGLKAAQGRHVYITTDTTLLSAGSRIGRTAMLLAKLIHPEAFHAPSETDANTGATVPMSMPASQSATDASGGQRP